MLAALSLLLGQLRTLNRPPTQATPAPAMPPTRPAQAARPSNAEATRSTSAMWSREIPELLREIRDTVLLDDEQRRQRWQRLQARRRGELVSAIRRALTDEGSLVEAQRLLSHLGEKFPDAQELDGLSAEYERARLRLQALDVEQTRRKIQELEGVNSYQRAEEVAEALVMRHPELAAPKDLLAQVRQDRENYLDKERARHFADLDRLTLEKKWSEALRTAESFLVSFPRSGEAGLVRERLPLLRTNAEIASRQRLEAQFKVQLQEHRYAEALRLARHIVETYPDSPQAEALRDQIPRLSHLAQVGE
jgi:hypothetical protein